jgi:hypothetical protein
MDDVPYFRHAYLLGLEDPPQARHPPAVCREQRPGAFAHTARNAPLTLAIAQDMERLCPDAWYLNFSNPMIRLTWVVHRYTQIKVVGLCHQLLWGYAMAAAVLADRLRKNNALTGVAHLDTDSVIFGSDNYRDDAARRRVTHTVAQQIDQLFDL